MIKKHLKTLTVPVSWPIKRKGQTFVIRPFPGKAFETGMPLSLVLKDMLSYCKTSKEVKALLRDKEIMIDGKRRKEEKYLVGLMDVLSIPLTKEYFRMEINKNKRLELVKIDAEEAGLKILKIIGKTTIKKGFTQLNFFDGRNLTLKGDKYKIGDSVVVKIPTQEITEHLTFEKGSYAYVTEGGHTGYHGLIEEIIDGSVKIKSGDVVFITPKKTVFVIGKNKPLIKMND
jgi:small subunit ribosomal protein S4e